MPLSDVRLRVWEIVEPHRTGDLHSHLFDLLIIGLILLNVLAVILESVNQHWFFR